MSRPPADRSVRPPRRQGLTGALMGSLMLHGVLGLAAGAWIVAQYIQPPPPRFVAPPAPRLKIPPQTRQHRMNLAAHAGLASKPTFKQRLVSLRPTAFALPEAPRMPLDSLLTPDPASLTAGMISGLAGSAGTGAGGGFGLAGAGGKGLGAGLNFLGIQAQGQRILLLFDVSASVVNKAASSGLPLARIKEETRQMIDKLPVDARFGLIQFVRNYKPFQTELVPATKANRDLARAWIDSEWSESGQMARSGRGVIAPTPNGLPPILRAGFAMNPDVVFLISDGSFERGAGGSTEKVPDAELEALIEELQQARTGKAPIHFVGFRMRDEDKAFWTRMVRRTGGRLREIQ